jgi:hypothetical protein
MCHSGGAQYVRGKVSRSGVRDVLCSRLGIDPQTCLCALDRFKVARGNCRGVSDLSGGHLIAGSCYDCSYHQIPLFLDLSAIISRLAIQLTERLLSPRPGQSVSRGRVCAIAELGSAGDQGLPETPNTHQTGQTASSSCFFIFTSCGFARYGQHWSNRSNYSEIPAIFTPHHSPYHVSSVQATLREKARGLPSS